MDARKKKVAENAIRKLALREGKTVAEIRREMQAAILAGKQSQDPTAQAFWKSIPSSGKIPTPEELIVCIVNQISN